MDQKTIDQINHVFLKRATDGGWIISVYGKNSLQIAEYVAPDLPTLLARIESIVTPEPARAGH